MIGNLSPESKPGDKPKGKLSGRGTPSGRLPGIHITCGRRTSKGPVKNPADRFKSRGSSAQPEEYYEWKRQDTIDTLKKRGAGVPQPRRPWPRSIRGARPHGTPAVIDWKGGFACPSVHSQEGVWQIVSGLSRESGSGVCRANLTANNHFAFREAKNRPVRKMILDFERGLFLS